MFATTTDLLRTALIWVAAFAAIDLLLAPLWRSENLGGLFSRARVLKAVLSGCGGATSIGFWLAMLGAAVASEHWYGGLIGVGIALAMLAADSVAKSSDIRRRQVTVLVATALSAIGGTALASYIAVALVNGASSLFSGGLDGWCVLGGLVGGLRVLAAAGAFNALVTWAAQPSARDAAADLRVLRQFWAAATTALLVGCAIVKLGPVAGLTVGGALVLGQAAVITVCWSANMLDNKLKAAKRSGWYGLLALVCLLMLLASICASAYFGTVQASLLMATLTHTTRWIGADTGWWALGGAVLAIAQTNLGAWAVGLKMSAND